jgi:hypothetical protein
MIRARRRHSVLYDSTFSNGGGVELPRREPVGVALTECLS